jgi:hypothetical protein
MRLEESLQSDQAMFGSVSGAPNGVTLYTSLPARIERRVSGRELGAAYQRECIASWWRRGFDVVSLNTRAEIEALLPLGYEVRYREVEIGRPRINDFLTVIKEEPGIINADCIMVANDQAISLVLQSARLGLVLTERVNIGAEEVKATGSSCYGFDLLLFAKQFLYNLEFDPEISIGTPWWDYWFPIVYQLGGGQLFRPPAPMLIHLDHKQGWSRESWLAHGRRMHDALTRHNDQGGSLPFIKYGETNGLSEQEVCELATAAFQWLKTVPQAMNVDDPSVWLWCSLLAGIEAVPREAREAEQRFREVERGYKEAEQCLKNSLSWRVTRPLRFIEDKLSQFRLPISLRSFFERLTATES